MVQRVNRNVDFVTDDDNNLVGFQVKPGDVRALAKLATDAAGKQNAVASIAAWHRIKTINVAGRQK